LERAFAFGTPSDLVRPFDAVLGLAGDGCNGAQGDLRSWCVHVELALDAGGHRGIDHSSLTLETYDGRAPLICLPNRSF